MSANKSVVKQKISEADFYPQSFSWNINSLCLSSSEGALGNRDLNLDPVVDMIKHFKNYQNVKRLYDTFDFCFSGDLPSSALSSKAGIGDAHLPQQRILTDSGVTAVTQMNSSHISDCSGDISQALLTETMGKAH